MNDETADHSFWADDVADRVLEREPDEPIVIKGGISPSGVPHLGNANEIVLGWFVAEVLRERGYPVRQVFTTDDRDPLRALPRTLADLDGELVELGDVDAAALGRNLGRPYAEIPDPFGCCESYGAHFTVLIADIAEALDIPVEVVSTTELYESGAFDETIRTVLDRRDEFRDVLREFQDKVDEEYVPFKPHCEACGKETETVTGIDLEAGSVSYRCTDITAGNQTIDGCGHEGTATLSEGKLPWRFEWVAQWGHLGVDFEPFGKDHAEGSWPSGLAIAEQLGIEPPVPMVYEWFTLDGKPFSSSEGNVLTVKEALELVEPATLRYFFAKDPTRARDFSIANLDQFVDQFDRLEAIALGRVDPADPDERTRAERLYPFLVEESRPERVRIPYRFAAVLGMTDDPSVRERIARKEGHIPDDAPDWAVEEAMARVERARRWARRTDNAYNYELKRSEPPNLDIHDVVGDALDEVAAVVAADGDGDDIQQAFFSSAEEHDLSAGTLFETGYQLFLGREDGPQLGPFLATLDRDFVIDRLRREG